MPQRKIEQYQSLPIANTPMPTPHILIVGGAGYIGSHMVKMLARLGCLNSRPWTPSLGMRGSGK